MPLNPVNVQKTFTYLRLEPYEGKLSSTVLRRERRGNPPDPADADSIMWATASIDSGRKGIATRGKAEEGRYKRAISSEQ
jgi:hypothetical protein